MRHSIAETVFVAAVFLGCSSVSSGGRARGDASTGILDPARPVAVTAAAIVAESERLAARGLWPGFVPDAIPVAIYDGERTWLFRHPSPPAGFELVAGREGVGVHDGRHPAVTANSSADIGGAATATLLLPAEGANVQRLAGVLLHEAFHVFQRSRHPGWIANEVDLFTYPVDDADLLALRRAETEALRRALATTEERESACWAAAALRERRGRFARLGEKGAAYEVGTEWNEGLARYVESRATGMADAAIMAEAPFAADAIRQRGYSAGAALARLLDRHAAGWQAALERDDKTPLHVLLAGALESAGGGSACEISGREREVIVAAAAEAVEAVQSRRAARRAEFTAASGWRLVLVADAAAPLWPQGFDPLNVTNVAVGEVLHARYLKLGNDAGTIEVNGRASLTEAAGAHPLFNGVRRLTITGIAAAPSMSESGGSVKVRADGLTGEFRGASLEVTGQEVVIRMPGGR